MVQPRLPKLLSRLKISESPTNTKRFRRQRIHSKDTTANADDERFDRACDPSEKRAPTTIASLPLELLQHIFSFLDCVALLKARCVCPLWAKCIPSNSADLQRALFLPRINTTPSPKAAALYLEIFTTAPTNYPRYSRARVLSIPQVTKIALAFQTRCVNVHPLIEKIDRFLVARIPDLDLIGPDAHRDDIYFTHLKNKAGNLLQPDDIPMLRDMFATSPPVTSLHIKFRYLNREYGEIEPKADRWNCLLDDTEGVLFGDLWYVLEMQVMGLLRLETMRRIDARPEKYLDLAELREKVRDATCPV